jgi:short-subunit dehydrogenase
MNKYPVQLQNGTAVITGAANGIGLEIAKHAHQLNMNLVLADINFDQLLRFKEDLLLTESKTLLLKTDVSQEAEIEHLCIKAYEKFGSIELLCNNAGVSLNRLSWKHSHQDWEWLMNVNLFSVAHGIRYFVPRMLEQGTPAYIVNTASAAGLLSTPGMAAYNASKHAVVTLSETLFQELHSIDAKIHVSVLCPAWVPTQIHLAQRNRPERFGAHQDPSDPVSLQYEDRMSNAVQAGKMSASEIADEVFQAIEKQQFYIIPHRKINSLIEQRHHEITHLQNPKVSVS